MLLRLKPCLALLLLAGLTVVNAEAASTTANIASSIVVPIGIAKVTDLSFGKVYLPAGLSGDYTITPAGAIVSSTNVKAFSQANSVAAAGFSVTGDGNAAFSISLPLNGSVTIAGPGTAIPIKNFVCDLGATSTLVAGSRAMSIGATMTPSAGQAAGSYAGSFTVTVDYN